MHILNPSRRGGPRPLAIAAVALAGAGLLAARPPQAQAQTAHATAPAVAAVAAAATAVPTVGVQDSWINSCVKQKPGHPSPSPADDSPYWAGLGVGTARFSPPWDIASPHRGTRDGRALTVEQGCFDTWLRALAAHPGNAVTPEIAFRPDYNYKSGKRIIVPGLATYEAAMRAFTDRYSNCPGTATTCQDGTARVRIIAPWGEPEFKGKQVFYLKSGRRFDATRCPAHPTDANCGPVLAAQMWVTVQHRCPSCTVIAGDFGSNKGKDFAYLSTYERYLRDLHGGHRAYRPAVWAIHPYTDVIAYERELQARKQLRPARDTLVAAYAKRLRRARYGRHTQVWLDEVSSFTVDFSNHTRAVQAGGAKALMICLPRAGGATAAGEPSVTRIYYMRFAGAPHDALIVGGTPQPVYYAVANRSHEEEKC